MSKTRIIMASSPKGGVGKSTLCRNLLVCAAHSGKKVLGLDFDAQRTLATWAERRERIRETFPDCLAVPVQEADLGDWRGAIRRAKSSGADVIVIDTPPSIEINISAILSLSGEADLLLIPCQPSQDDLDSAAPWMQRLAAAKVHAAFVMNRANRRTRSFGAIRTKLLALGAICPVEIPPLEEIAEASSKGLAIADLSKAASTETFDGLWSYVAREAKL
ncbi:ParA family protein [Teichococcus aestuarii]|uniref:Cobyrinic acid ac-diamide synthase n=1 Tax=Teichococcus aestuarii TaxID=568898 RepID=A0A2U1UYD9_9PROT|nr:ParA family protein [Pseudoroseomonas aestuarii]PWC26621.1 cobyrinic acid ac-diamide synthase [Pseudoroseomonas aestuarii]